MIKDSALLFLVLVLYLQLLVVQNTLQLNVLLFFLDQLGVDFFLALSATIPPVSLPTKSR